MRIHNTASEGNGNGLSLYARFYYFHFRNPYMDSWDT